MSPPIPLKIKPLFYEKTVGVSPGRLQNRPALSLAFLAPAAHPRGLAHVTTIQTGIRLPVRLQLCSTGFPVGFRVTAFYPRFGA
jgi:hypothetical protein